MRKAVDVDELERHLRATARADATTATDAQASRDVKRAIARRRGLTAGSIGAATAVVVGAVAVGGLGLTDIAESPTPSPAPDLSIDRGSVDYATVALPDDEFGDDPFYDSWQEWCGAPAPEPLRAADDFRADFDVPERLDLDRADLVTVDDTPTAAVSLTYSERGPLPAFTGVLTALLVQDGVVVGIDGTDNPQLVTFKPGQEEIALWRWHNWFSGCGDSPHSDPPPAGEYEVVFVTHVRNDLESAARSSLHSEGFSLPPSDSLTAFEEGSYRCSQWERWSMYQPLTCAPTALVGFELDPATGTATIPYDTSLYTHDVDVTVVSQPVPTTLGPVTQFQHIDGSLSTYDPNIGPMCGDVYGDLGGTGDLNSSWPTPRTAPSPGDVFHTRLWVQSRGWEHAAVAVPEDPRIWLTRATPVETQIAEGLTSYGWVGHEVIGWLDTESQQSDVAISDYDGPTTWPLTVTDVQRCEGANGEPVDEISPADQLMGVIEGPVTVQLDGGTPTTVPTMFLSPIDSF